MKSLKCSQSQRIRRYLPFPIPAPNGQAPLNLGMKPKMTPEGISGVSFATILASRQIDELDEQIKTIGDPDNAKSKELQKLREAWLKKIQNDIFKPKPGHWCSPHRLSHPTTITTSPMKGNYFTTAAPPLITRPASS